MSSSASSDASASPSPSPTASKQDLRELPTLERLVTYLVSAKRALTSIQHVENATQLVSSSRSMVEDIAVARARNTFVQAKTRRQIDILHAIGRKIASSADEVDNEFQSVIARLDDANDRLQATITSLKGVIVDASIHRTNIQHEHTASNEDDASEDDATEPDTPTKKQIKDKTLFDFVDESQYNELSETLKTFIDSFHDSRDSLERQLDSLNTSTTDIANMIENVERPESPTVKATLYDDPTVPVAEAFGHMEEHAAEMAGLLQMLISHYDLCVSALKHTEGGREAARQAVLGAEDGDGLSHDQILEESLYEPKVADPITNEQRSEMLRVIEGDAAEVDGAVEDLRGREAEIERFHKQLTVQVDNASSEGRRHTDAVKALRRLRTLLPGYIDATDQFRTTWVEIQATIDDKMQEIINLTAFYEEFIAGYDRLLHEVARRKAAEAQMQKVADKAQRELDRLHEADRLIREEFVEDVGSFLPSDLWPGVVEGGVRWHLRAEPLALAPADEAEQSHGIEIA